MELADAWVDSVLDRLGELSAKQAALFRQKSELLAQQHTEKTHAFFMTEESTVEGRKHAANYAALGYSTEIFRIDGELSANAEEQAHLRDTLTYTRRGA